MLLLHQESPEALMQVKLVACYKKVYANNSRNGYQGFSFFFFFFWVTGEMFIL